jgi:hypothetical protein
MWVGGWAEVQLQLEEGMDLSWVGEKKRKGKKMGKKGRGRGRGRGTHCKCNSRCSSQSLHLERGLQQTNRRGMQQTNKTESEQTNGRGLQTNGRRLQTNKQTDRRMEEDGHPLPNEETKEQKRMANRQTKNGKRTVTDKWKRWGVRHMGG